MTAALIARTDVTDPEQYCHHLSATPSLIGRYGRKAAVRSADPLTPEGPEDPHPGVPDR